MKATSTFIFFLCGVLMLCIGCRQNTALDSDLTVHNLTQLQLEEAGDEGDLIVEVPAQIGQLGQHAVTDYLAVFSFEEIADMAEDLRIAVFLEQHNLRAPLASLLVDRSDFSQLQLTDHLSPDQIAELNNYQLKEQPQDCYNSFRYKWNYRVDEWSIDKCGILHECIGNKWIPIKAALCVASEKGDAPMHWATSFP